MFELKVWRLTLEVGKVEGGTARPGPGRAGSSLEAIYLWTDTPSSSSHTRLSRPRRELDRKSFYLLANLYWGSVISFTPNTLIYFPSAVLYSLFWIQLFSTRSTRLFSQVNRVEQRLHDIPLYRRDFATKWLCTWTPNSLSLYFKLNQVKFLSANYANAMCISMPRFHIWKWASFSYSCDVSLAVTLGILWVSSSSDSDSEYLRISGIPGTDRTPPDPQLWHARAHKWLTNWGFFQSRVTRLRQYREYLLDTRCASGLFYL